MDTSGVTRVEVFHEGFMVFHGYVGATVELQDDGRTLKVFVTALSDEARAAAEATHNAELTADLRRINERNRT